MKLCLGGTSRKEGWTILNATGGDFVDLVCDVRKMTFPDASIEEIYASHVLEHLSFTEVMELLGGFYRMLIPGGVLYIAVPDMEVLSDMLLSKEANEEVKFHVLKMMYGGQVDEWDFHKSGWTQNILAELLIHKGFRDLHRVRKFNIFEDTSSFEPYGIPISLNIVCLK